MLGQGITNTPTFRGDVLSRPRGSKSPLWLPEDEEATSPLTFAPWLHIDKEKICNFNEDYGGI